MTGDQDFAAPAHGRNWPGADIPALLGNVCFAGKSGRYICF